MYQNNNEHFMQIKKEMNQVCGIMLMVWMIVDCVGLLLMLTHIIDLKLFGIFVSASGLTLIILTIFISMKKLYG
jgi:hypothetical protein